MFENSWLIIFNQVIVQTRWYFLAYVVEHFKSTFGVVTRDNQYIFSVFVTITGKSLIQQVFNQLIFSHNYHIIQKVPGTTILRNLVRAED